ncbi:MAG TPA: hypothetical protein ENI11_04615 [Actinobacteria bacterium]|nr:hypothetical protein [Actinomycetota bacterium]
MQKDITNPGSLHAIRKEFQKARLAKQSLVATINIEDAIFTRIIEAEELLTVAIGLFTELAENKDNWLFKFQDDINDARWTLHNLIHDRPFA